MISRREFLKAVGIGLVEVGLDGVGLGKKNASVEQKNTIEEYKYTIGETEVSLTKKNFGPGPIFFNMHSNEETSINAILPTLKERNIGSLIELQNNKKRNVAFTLNKKEFIFDPNRIFNKEGVEKTLANLTLGYYKMSVEEKEQAITAVENFGQKILCDLGINKAEIVIALHNNHQNGWSIDSYLSKGDQKNNALDVKKSEKYDKDDFIYVTCKEDFDYLVEKGYSVVLHNPDTKTDDGSLVTFLANKKIRYFNSETQHGHIKTQEKMLKDILEFINKNTMDKK